MRKPALAFFLMMLGVWGFADVCYRAEIIRPEGNRDLQVEALNDHGAVTGFGLFNSGSNAAHMFRWTTESGFDDLGVHESCSGFCQTGGWDINNNDEIVGFGDTASFSSLMHWDQATGFFAHRFLDLAAVINDAGWIGGMWVGNINSGAAALWRPESGYLVLGDLPGGERYAWPTAINNAELVCGIGTDANDEWRAFIWDEVNGLRAMPPMEDGAPPNDAIAMNNLGQILGARFSLTEDYSYLWDPVTGYSRLEHPDANFMEAWAINDRTEIVGTGVQSSSSFPCVYDPNRGYRNLNDDIDPCVGPLNRLQPRDINNVGQILCYSREGTMGAAFGYLLTPYVKGDLNGDNVVDLSDLAILLSNFGRSGDADYAAGDLDCDADVDLQDLATQLSGFGESYP